MGSSIQTVSKALQTSRNTTLVIIFSPKFLFILSMRTPDKIRAVLDPVPV